MRRLLPAAAIGLIVLGAVARAADHADSPRVKNEPAADLTDLYAWMSSDASRLNLILSVFPKAGPEAAFSNAVEYVFNIDSMQQVGGTMQTERIVCTFDAQQQVTCRVGAEVVTGDASGPEGLASQSGRFRVFAGRRNDPFFFNLNGFQATVAQVKTAAPNLTLDAAGCPTLDETTAEQLATQLSKEPGGGEATNDFAADDVLTLSIQIDKTLVNRGGPILGVWASTNSR